MISKKRKASQAGFFSRLFGEIPFLLFGACSLLLLLYVGYAETKVRFLEFQTGKLELQADVIAAEFDSYLGAGLPLQQFARFDSIARSLLRSDENIKRVWVVDNSAKMLFSLEGQEGDLRPTQSRWWQGDLGGIGNLIRILGNRTKSAEAEVLQAKAPLFDRFGQVGEVNISEYRQTGEDFFERHFSLALNIFFCLVIFLILASIFTARRKATQQRVSNVSFITSFLIMIATLGYIILSVYDKGASDEASALSDLLTQRLKSVQLQGLALEDWSGLDQTLEAFNQAHPDIVSVAISKGGVIESHTNADLKGSLMPRSSGVIRISSELGDESRALSGFSQQLHIDFDRDIVFRKIKKSAGTFLVLLIAFLLFVIITMGARTKRRVRLLAPQRQVDKDNEVFLDRLKLLKPAYFMVVFVGAMSASFFPQLVDELAAVQKNFWASSSLPFALYYLSFALILLPTRSYAHKGKAKQLMLYGFIAESLGRGIIAFYGDYWMIVTGGIVSGLGQGMFLVGFQTYLLMVTPQSKHTQGAAIRVISRNTGMIAGIAVGALLYSYLNYKELFMLSSLISLVSLVYVLFAVPSTDKLLTEPAAQGNQTSRRKASMWKCIKAVLKDIEVLKTLVFVGLLSKIAITGVIMFALPLMLARYGFKSVGIGQLLMLYYVSSIIATWYASSVVDQMATTKPVLVASALIGGLAFVLIGLLLQEQQALGLTTGQWLIDEPLLWLSQIGTDFKHFFENTQQSWQLYLMMVGVCLAGVSNGLIAAPILSHMSNTTVTWRYGNKVVINTYVFLERAGHVIGPLFIYGMLRLFGQSSLAVSAFGLFVVVMGLLFLVLARSLKVSKIVLLMRKSKTLKVTSS